MSDEYNVSANVPLNKTWILQRVTQEEIMEYYLGEPVQTETQFCNPLRNDQNPTCNYIYYGRKLRFRDWSWPTTLDCFDVVKQIHGCSFRGALEQIAHDFGLAGTKPREKAVKELKQLRQGGEEKGVTPITVALADGFRKQTIEYFTTQGVHGEQIRKYDVKPLDRVWLRGQDYWSYWEEDPAVGYYFGTRDGHQLWQIYFYRRTENPRFLSNNGVLQGYRQLPECGERLVITKSLKDVMALDHFGIPAVAPAGESQPIAEDTIRELKERFATVVSLFDFDLAGIGAAKRLAEDHDIPYLFFGDGRFGTREFVAKDFSEFVARNGERAAEHLIRQVMG